MFYTPCELMYTFDYRSLRTTHQYMGSKSSSVAMSCGSQFVGIVYTWNGICSHPLLSSHLPPFLYSCLLNGLIFKKRQERGLRKLRSNVYSDFVNRRCLKLVNRDISIDLDANPNYINKNW